MRKIEQINYWKNTALEDWAAVQALVNAKSYVQALFFCHLVIEKLLKANWIKLNEGVPPRIHDLIYLHDQTNLELNEQDLRLLSVINSWNLEGRYPDYKNSFHKMASSDFVNDVLPKVETLQVCLLKKLSEK